ncbi:MAG: hypothetical protein H6582_01030 [Crocinitomicaceae bacterium]|nr:hypothetical protein [Crocinitomicaceae bacterium]
MSVNSKNIFLILALFLFASSCDLNRNKPNEKQLESDRECVHFYEGIANEFQLDSISNYNIEHEQFLTADENHRLLKKTEQNEELTCEYRGIRDYGKVTIVEIKSWRYFAGRYTNLEIFERHMLLVGDWNSFNVDQLLWRKNEKIVHEEVLGNESKLLVTHVNACTPVPGH